jgi:hypothetical protein
LNSFSIFFPVGCGPGSAPGLGFILSDWKT